MPATYGRKAFSTRSTSIVSILRTVSERSIGDAEDPLLVSVRSGAPMSMPGMMDTVLNLGLNDESINGLIKQTENPRFAWDSYRRFIQMFSNVVMGLDGDLFENAINAMKAVRGVKSDTDLTAEDLQELVAEFKGIFTENVSGEEYPALVVDGVRAVPAGPDGAAASLPSRLCSAVGTTPARSSTARRTRSPTTWAPPSTCSAWSSATRATRRPRASPSRATPPTAQRSSTATTW